MGHPVGFVPLSKFCPKDSDFRVTRAQARIGYQASRRWLAKDETQFRGIRQGVLCFASILSMYLLFTLVFSVIEGTSTIGLQLSAISKFPVLLTRRLPKHCRC